MEGIGNHMRCAIVGCGAIALMHAKIIQEIENSCLIAVADNNYGKAVDFANEFGLDDSHAYPSLEEMCKYEEIDVLHVCTPHYLHVPMAVFGLKHGMNVFMEKPPAISNEQFKLLERASKEYQLGICFQNRFNKSVKVVSEILSKEETGRIRGARAFVTWNREKDYYTNSSWRGTWAKGGGGVLINQSIHTLDLLIQFMGKPIWTEASIHNHHLKYDIEVEDTLEAYIEFEKGPVCFFATNAYIINAPVFIEIECENVTIRMEDSQVTKIYKDGHRINENFSNNYTIGKDYWGTGHIDCIREFQRCIRTKVQFPINIDNVKDIFKLTMDIYQSAKKEEVIMFHKEYKLSGFADEIDDCLDRQIEVLHECHISYLELRSAYGKNISKYSLEEAKELKEKLDKEAIKVSAIGSPIGKMNIGDEFDKHFQLFCHVVELAKLFETKYIRIFSFYIPEGDIAESYMDKVIERLKIMINYAKEQGVILLHENEKGIYGDSISRCKELMDVLYCDNFKQTFDFANFIQCYQEPLEAFQILKPYIEYIHIKDARKDNRKVVPAGYGDGQIATIIQMLKVENYHGFYSLEPHLTEFKGLEQLERINEKTNIGNDMTDGRTAFMTAYYSFDEILKNIK